MGVRPYHVLVVDDDPDHVMITRIVFTHMDPNARVQVCASAEEAIEVLEAPDRGGDEESRRRPDVIVLDIDMPGIGGIGFLEWYAEQPEHRRIPVVVFTGSGADDLEERCLSLGASGFMTKQPDFTPLVPTVVQAMERGGLDRATGSG